MGLYVMSSEFICAITSDLHADNLTYLQAVAFYTTLLNIYKYIINIDVVYTVCIFTPLWPRLQSTDHDICHAGFLFAVNAFKAEVQFLGKCGKSYYSINVQSGETPSEFYMNIFICIKIWTT